MSVEAALLNIPRKLSCQDQVYDVNLITGKVKAEVERALVARAETRVKRRKIRDNLSRKEILDEMRLIEEKEDAGDYTLERNIAVLISTPWGQDILLKLLMPGCSEEVRKDIIDQQPDDVNWCLQRVFQESFPTSTKMSKEAEVDGPFEHRGLGGGTSGVPERPE